MTAFFLPPDDLQLDELTNATLMKLEQFRDRTSTGQSLSHSVGSTSLHCLMEKCQLPLHFLSVISVSEALSYFLLRGCLLLLS